MEPEELKGMEGGRAMEGRKCGKGQLKPKAHSKTE